MTISDAPRAHQLEDIELPERYRLVRHLADGGMASVWCAEDSVLSRRVAVKLLSPEFRHDARATRCFEREARAAARLSGHRNIVTIFDVGEARWREPTDAAGPAFIVMELLAGGTVADALRVGGMTRDRARGWIRETASALDYAHSRGVVHCDVKPANLLLDNHRVLHIADFGIARIASEDTAVNGHLFGTAAYLSPEQARGDRATAASDLYALAVVAFELLVGERPFDGQGFINTARAHLEQEPPAASARRPELPIALDAVLRRGMAKRPEDRWATASRLAEAIDTALAPISVTFTRPVASARVAGPVPARHGPPRRPVAERRPPQPPHAARGRLAASAAIAAAVIMTAVAFALSGAAKHHQVLARAPAPPTPTRRPAAAASTRSRPAPAPKPKAHPAPASTSVGSAPPPASAAGLESQGHSLMLAGSYPAALQVLQQALRSAPDGSLIYQWALYDLAHTYREMGNLGNAITLLRQRIRYPYARAVVQQELSTAISSSQRSPTPKFGAGRSKQAPHKHQPDGSGPAENSAQD